MEESFSSLYGSIEYWLSYDECGELSHSGRSNTFQDDHVMFQCKDDVDKSPVFVVGPFSIARGLMHAHSIDCSIQNGTHLRKGYSNFYDS